MDMHPLIFAKDFLRHVEFNCNRCRMFEYGQNCKENRNSACVQVRKLLNKILDEKIEEQNLSNN